MKKAISVTPAGRAKYLNILARYLARCKDVVEEHHFWVNTVNRTDIQAMKDICAADPDFFKMIQPNVPSPYDGFTIGSFFKDYIEEGRVYVRLDDDVCWVDDGAIAKLIEFRLSHPEYFLVYSNIVNNTFLNSLHQNLGLCPLGIRHYWSGPDAASIHDRFLGTLRSGNLKQYDFGTFENHDRVKIPVNVMSWMGQDLAPIKGKFEQQEEIFLALEYPAEINRINAVCGSSHVVHFAYAPQREYLETYTDYLKRYEYLSIHNKVPAWN